ncbi:NF-kappa-B inhibitor delta [Bombina bombina]|uniref:NF-kappa-B inhibitor delta n=1 Tax=Bombina bombina TaxID=8345 RepID=UPI00235AED01|nr:NF-kappa-B inhibitor delta [Bombina bombina]
MDAYCSKWKNVADGLYFLQFSLTDCRPYCPPPQTVKKLLEEKRQRKTSQVSASLVEFTQETGVASSASFLHHPPSQPEDESLVYLRPAPHYTYTPLEDFYVSRPGTVYIPDQKYETVRNNAEIENVDVPSMSYLSVCPNNPSWLEQSSGSCSASGAESVLWMSGFLVADLNQLALEEARAEIQNLNPDQLLLRDEDGDTILHLYAAKGLRYLSYAVAERCLMYGQLDTKEHNGKSPLLVAVAANQPEIVYDLITLGADLNASDWKGQTALHVAGTYGFSNVLKVFSSFNHQQNIDVEARNYEGLTPLHCAVISENSAYKNRHALATPDSQEHERETFTCVQLLLQLGANCESQDIKSNKTVLHLAVQAGNIPLVKFILSLPHLNLPRLVNMKAHGNTALHMAAALPPLQSTHYLIQLLIFAGGDPSIRNLENEQPAHLVPPGEFSEQIKLLLKRRRVMSSARHQSSSSL